MLPYKILHELCYQRVMAYSLEISYNIFVTKFQHNFAGEVENLPLFNAPTESESMILLQDEDHKDVKE